MNILSTERAEATTTQVAESYKQNNTEDSQNPSHTSITDSGWEGQSEGEMSKNEFLEYLEVLE